MSIGVEFFLFGIFFAFGVFVGMALGTVCDAFMSHLFRRAVDRLFAWCDRKSASN